MALQSHVETLAYSFMTFAEATGISHTNLRKDAKDGLLKTRKRGRRHIITKEEGLEYLSNLKTA